MSVVSWVEGRGDGWHFRQYSQPSERGYGFVCTPIFPVLTCIFVFFNCRPMEARKCHWSSLCIAHRIALQRSFNRQHLLTLLTVGRAWFTADWLLERNCCTAGPVTARIPARVEKRQVHRIFRASCRKKDSRSVVILSLYRPGPGFKARLG